MDVPPAAEGLFAVPPSRFTAERDALATALASRGDPAAATVRKLRRPVGLAWLLNRLARERPDEVRALVAAGDRLRAGQQRALAGGGADTLREADRELRERARALRSEGARILAGEGRRDDPVALARLELLLRAAAPARGPVHEAFRRGVLEREPEVAGELVGLTVLPGGRAGIPPAAARARGGRPGAQRGAGRDAERRREEQASRRARERELARLRKDLGAAAERAARAERRAAVAEERAAKERARAAKEREEAERARRRLEDVERRR